MTKEGIFRHAFSKIALAFLLIISMVAPFITVQSASAATSISVAEAIAKNNSGESATVKGYIVGFTSGTNSYKLTGPFTGNVSNIAIADSPDETDPAKIMPVELKSGTAFRTELNLSDNPTLHKQQVEITGSLVAYFTVKGIKSLTGYTILDGGTPPPPPPVAEEKADLAAARAEVGSDKLIKVQGTVTTGTGFWGGKAFYIQDASAGIYVYTTAADVNPGDVVELEGKVSTYSGELQLQPSKITKISSNNTLPLLQEVSPAGVNEDTQGERILLDNVTITNLVKVNDFGTFEFTAEDADGRTVVIRNDNRNGLAYDDFIKRYKDGDLVDVTGIASKFNTTYQVKTLGLESFDLVNKPAVYTDVFPGTVSAGSTVALITPIENAKIYYTVDGSTPTAASTEYTAPIELTKDVTIKAIAVSDTTSEVFSFTYNVLKVDNLVIRDIQGEGHYSDYEGATVNDITGVVTHVYNSSNFVIQDVNADEDNTTSEAIIVNKTSNGLSVGDLVTVAGTVEEWYYEGYSDMKTADLPVTRIRATTAVANGTHELPAPLVIGEDIFPATEIIDNDGLTSFDPAEDGIDFWESVELMRIAVPNAKVVGPQKYGEVVVVAGNSTETEFNVLGGINISANDYNPERVIVDFDNESYDAKSGDYYTGNIVGVMGFGFGNYKLWTKEDTLPEITRVVKPVVVTDINKVEDKLNVAAYNVENFSNNIEQTPNEKVEKIAKSFVENMKSPDIITLVEVQDNDGATASNNADATESYERLIAAIVAAGGPTYAWTDIAPEYNQDGGQPGGNIRVGYLYNPERVTLAAGTKGGSTEAVTWVDGELSKNPGRILDLPQQNTRKPLAAQFEFQGEKVVVIGAHLNSKGGDQPLFGKNQPPFLGSEAERIELATMINNFVKAGQAQDPNLKVIVAGDMNDFEFTPTLAALKGGILTNMVEKVPAGDRFSYYYQGNNQVLDHVLVTNNLADTALVDMIHINANYMDIHGRASDHDPILIQVDLKDPVVVPDLKTLSVDKTTVALQVGGTEQLTVTETTTKADESSTDEDVTATATYSGYNSDVISVVNGLITAKAAGTTSITVTVGDNTETVNVTVTAAPVADVKTLSVNKTNVQFMYGQTETLVVTETTTKADNTSTKADVTATATYSGYNTNFINVNNGVITATGIGQTEINVTVGDNTVKVFVTVTSIPPQPPVTPEPPVDPQPEKVTFGDVASHWAKKEIEVLATKKIILGKTDKEFAPEAKLTRAEFAVLVSRALGLELKAYEGKFSDVTSNKEWAYAGIEAAARTGIINGFEDGTFAPDAEITREEIAAIIIRAVKHEDAALLNNLDTSKAFADGKHISTFAKESVQQAVALGIINGRGGNVFSPQDDATRAETAVILYRALNKLGEL